MASYLRSRTPRCYTTCAGVMLALAVLSGCATPVLTPIVVTAADRRPGPVDLSLPAAGGVALPARVWPAAGRPRAAVLALHGFDDSRDAWELSGPVFAAQGIAVYAPDQRGFGAAPGRGRWAGKDVMLADVRTMLREVVARTPGVPLYLMGESMGGAEAQCLAAERLPGVAGVVLLAPAVWSADEMGLALTVPLRLAAAVAPDWRLTGRELPLHIVASDNRAALIRLSYDPLTLVGTRVAALDGLVRLMSAARAAAPRVRMPTLIAYGGHDQLVPSAAMAENWRALPHGVRRAFYPQGYHLLMRDRGRQAVIGDVIAWIADPSAPLPSGADLAAAAWVAGGVGQEEVPPWLPGNLDALADAPGGAPASY